MPTYQYVCPKCDLRFELKQSFSDEPVTTCPKCQNGARRLFSPVAIIFKGSGFYVTDNPGNGRGQSSTTEHKEEDETTSKKEDAKEAKSVSENDEQQIPSACSE